MGSSGGPPEEPEEEIGPAEGSPAAFSTRSEKVAFLKQLSSNEDYKVACKMLKGSLSFQDIDGLPDWASWSSGDRHLPDSLFEEEDSLELAITDIGAVASSVDHMEATLVLALGLVLRALNTAREANAVFSMPSDTKIADTEGQIVQTIQLAV